MTYKYDGSLFSKALIHHRDAGETIDGIPDHDDDADEHEKCVRAFHAHVKAMDDYCEQYRRAIGMDDDRDDEGDPEAGSTPEERRIRRHRRRVQELRAQSV
jgi:hypothetical protein